MNRTTEFSPRRLYRYTLWREWDECFWGLSDDKAKQYLMVIGLNPSTADETKDDPTIRRCIGFAKRWGYGALCMTNLFAWRDTLPENMKRVADPVGPKNDGWLLDCAEGAGMILAAWGKDGAHRERAESIHAVIQNIHCLKLNKDGSPIHPLYAKGDLVPVLL